MQNISKKSGTLNFVIVGGSLAGLFCGVVLKRHGHTVRILERNPTPLLHNQGAGIVAGGDVQDFFDRYDLTHQRLSVESFRGRQHLDRDGRVARRESYGQKMTSWDLLYHVLRANFDGVVDSGYSQALAEGEEKEENEEEERTDQQGEATYQYGARVTTLSERGHEVEVSYTDLDGVDQTTTADLVIAADGSGSRVREMLFPSDKRTYAGYVAFRGTVPENVAPQLCEDTFVDKFSFYSTSGTQILTYLIPGEQGNTNPGSRMINWVWYSNYAEASPEYAELMTDRDGRKHRVTLPVGLMQPSTWTAKKHEASQILPAPFAELVAATEHPFVQAITDSKASQITAFGGKVLLVGDAVAGFRPHTAASTNQAALHAALLQGMMDGDVEFGDVERVMRQYAEHMSGHGIRLGRSLGLGGD